MDAGSARDPEPNSAPAPAKARRQRWFEYLKPIPLVWSVSLGVAVWVIFFGLWELAAAKGWVNTLFMPPPHRVLSTLYIMLTERGFLTDIGISIYRILVSFALACAVAIPLGILMGSFKAVDAFVNPFVSAWRYLPAPAFIPLLLMWFGVGRGVEARASVHRRHLLPDHPDHGSHPRRARRADRDRHDARRQSLADPVDHRAAGGGAEDRDLDAPDARGQLDLSRHRRDRRLDHGHRRRDDAGPALPQGRRDHGRHSRDRHRRPACSISCSA